MAKLNKIRGSPQSWVRTPGTYISAQAHIDGADHAAVTMEQKWGVGRLRFWSVRNSGTSSTASATSGTRPSGMATWKPSASSPPAWSVLDGAASAASEGEEHVLSPEVWEVRLEDGTVAAIVKTNEEAHAIAGDGRGWAVYTLEEISRSAIPLPRHRPRQAVLPLAPPSRRWPQTKLIRSIASPIPPPGLDDPIEDLFPGTSWFFRPMPPRMHPLAKREPKSGQAATPATRHDVPARSPPAWSTPPNAL